MVIGDARVMTGALAAPEALLVFGVNRYITTSAGDTRSPITLGLPRWSALTPKVEVKSRLGPEEPRSILLPGNGTASTLWRHRFHRVRLVLASQRIGRPLPPG
jgi:hypothetical protein